MTATTTQGFVGVIGRNESFNVSNRFVPNNINALDGNDLISAFDGADLLVGGLGRDFMLGFAGDDTIHGDRFWNDEATDVNIALTAAGDAILGMSGADTIFAGGGNNFVSGGEGNDYVMGGSGNELLQGDGGNDAVYGGAGNDVLVGGTHNSADNTTFLNSNIGSITINFDGETDAAVTSFQLHAFDLAATEIALTNTGNDYLDGGLGDDLLFGGDGADTMVGGLGNDSFAVDDAGDIVTEREYEGIDEVYLSITRSLDSYVEHATMVDTAEGVLGNALANRITGNASGNWLNGAEGSDTIVGGLGADRLIGGSGDDGFIYNAVNEGGDQLLDFSSSEDTLYFRASAFGLPTGQLDGSRFASSIADGAPNSTVRFFYEEDTRTLRYDADGIDSAYAPVVIATLQEGASFSVSDVVLI
jgi:Ca2+-binding RTX toxin-like protein